MTECANTVENGVAGVYYANLFLMIAYFFVLSKLIYQITKILALPKHSKKTNINYLYMLD